MSRTPPNPPDSPEITPSSLPPSSQQLKETKQSSVVKMSMHVANWMSMLRVLLAYVCSKTQELTVSRDVRAGGAGCSGAGHDVAASSSGDVNAKLEGSDPATGDCVARRPMRHFPNVKQRCWNEWSFSKTLRIVEDLWQSASEAQKQPVDILVVDVWCVADDRRRQSLAEVARRKLFAAATIWES